MAGSITSKEELYWGKRETECLFDRHLTLKVETGGAKTIYSLTCEKTGRSATFTSKEICSPSVFKVKLLEISDHMSPCSPAELALLVNVLLKKESPEA